MAQHDTTWFLLPLLDVFRCDLKWIHPERDGQFSNRLFSLFSMPLSPGNFSMWWTRIAMLKLTIENVVKLVFNGNWESVRARSPFVSGYCLVLTSSPVLSMSSCSFLAHWLSCVIIWKSFINWCSTIIWRIERFSKKVNGSFENSSNWVSEGRPCSRICLIVSLLLSMLSLHLCCSYVF